MANILTTNWQQIGNYVKFYDESSYYYYYYAKYTKTGATTATVSVSFRTYGTGSETCSCSGATFYCTLNGVSKSVGTGGFSVNRKSFAGYYAQIDFPVEYDQQTGTWENKSISFRIGGGSGTYSGGEGLSTCASLSTISGSVTLPAIDPSPSASISSVAIQSDGYQNQVVASVTTLRATMAFAHAQQATLTVTGAGITTNYPISVTKASSETLTQDFAVPASSDDYTLAFTLTASNDTASVQATSSKAVKGYFLPTDGNATYTRRCDEYGNADTNGEYGRLYLTWNVAQIYETLPNTLQSCVVKLNNNTITATSGSIASGYLDFIFPLAVNVQGNLEVTFTDKILSNVITSLVVPKQTMPLSLYQNGNSVGVSVGRMATSSGFWCYEEFYLKQSNGTKKGLPGISGWFFSLHFLLPKSALSFAPRR